MALGLIAAVSRARAHAPPEIDRLVWDQSSDRVVLVTNRGLIFKAASSNTWHLLCDAALELATSEYPDLVYLPDGRLLAATSRGLRFTRDEGCEWGSVPPFGNTVTSALVQHPSRPDTIYVAVFGQGRGGIEASHDGGDSWVRSLALADDALISRLLFAPSMSARMYAIGQMRANPTEIVSHFLLRSSDAARTWQRFALPLRRDEARAQLLVVSPLDPDILLILAVSGDRETQPDRVLVSRDGGQSFIELWSSIGLRDAGFSADGKLAWIAGADGLWRSDEALASVTPVGSAQLMTCVGAHEGRLFACGHHSGFDPVTAGVGVSSDGGETFRHWMAFTDVKDPVTCSAASNAALACRALWTDWQLEILVGLAGAAIESIDAGSAVGSGSDASTPTPVPPEHDRSSCAVTAVTGVNHGELVALGFGWIVAAFRRRARCRSCQPLLRQVPKGRFVPVVNVHSTLSAPAP